MELEALRRCLHAHGLNQLGSTYILRRGLLEFVLRLRESASRALSNGSNNGDLEAFLRLKGTPAGSRGSGEHPVEFQFTKLDLPTVLIPDTSIEYLLIIDLEATCEDRRVARSSNHPQEVIEFPVLLYDTHARKCIGVFHSFCKPVRCPILTQFCTSLTGITQAQVDSAPDFGQLFYQLEHWLFVQNRLVGRRFAVVCDNWTDMARFLHLQCEISSIRMPPWATQWLNLSRSFHSFYGLPQGRKSFLKTMLEDLRLPFVGHHHSGIDDALNILRIVQVMLADGWHIRVNERIDPSKSSTFTASVTPILLIILLYIIDILNVWCIISLSQ